MIEVKILKDSINEQGVRLVSFEMEYGLGFSHMHMLTHRVFSRNTESRRAKKFESEMLAITENPYIPMSFGKNCSGMQPKEDLDYDFCKEKWLEARDKVIAAAQEFYDQTGCHKEVANRIPMAFSHVKVVLTATMYDGFFELRDHPETQVDTREIAKKMKAAMAESTPVLRKVHLPYVSDEEISKVKDLEELTFLACKSASCCAQVSYRRLDSSDSKTFKIMRRMLVTPLHASPFEHVAFDSSDALPNGCRNFVTGWTQFRSVVEEDMEDVINALDRVENRIEEQNN